MRVYYRKKQMDVSFLCVCPVIDNEFRHKMVKVVSYFDNDEMTKFMIQTVPVSVYLELLSNASFTFLINHNRERK